jgi:hypothetical protein
VSWNNNNPYSYSSRDPYSSNANDNATMRQITNALSLLRTMSNDLSEIDNSIGNIQRQRSQIEREEVLRRAREQLTLLRASNPRRSQPTSESSNSLTLPSSTRSRVVPLSPSQISRVRNPSSSRNRNAPINSDSSSRSGSSSSSSNLRRSSSRTRLRRSSSRSRLRNSTSSSRLRNNPSPSRPIVHPAWDSSAPTPPPRTYRHRSNLNTVSTSVSSPQVNSVRARPRTARRNVIRSNSIIRVPPRRIINVSPILSRRNSPAPIIIVPESIPSRLFRTPAPSPRSNAMLTDVNRRNSLNFVEALRNTTAEQWNSPVWTTLEKQEEDQFNRPQGDDFSDDVIFERETRRAVELSELTTRNELPSTFTVLNLPSSKEVQQAQINYSHLKITVASDILPDAPVDATLDDFAEILTISQAFAGLPNIIEDEDNTITRRTFIINTLGRLGEILNYETPQNLSPSRQAKAKQIKAIQKMMKHIIDALKKENLRIEDLPLSEKGQAKIDFADKMKTYFQDLGHAAIHCNDRIKQECELIVGDLFSDYSPTTETLEDKIMRKIQVFRNNTFKEAVIAVCRGRANTDISSTIEYYQNELKEELGLASSSGTEWSHLIDHNLGNDIRNKFYTTYTPQAMISSLKDSCKYGDLFKWFEDRYQVQGLGFEVSNDDCDGLKSEAIHFILHKMKIVL